MAGLVDGEGCIDARLFRDKRHKHKPLYIQPRIRVGLVESCRFILEIMKVNHGGNISDRKVDNPDWNNSASWSLQGTKLRPFLQNLVKHLILKKEQALLAIWIQDNLRKQGMQFKEEPKQCAYKEMRAMKTDPQRSSEAAIQKIINCPEYHYWSPNYDACRDCGTTEKSHNGNGYCATCRQRHYRAGDFERIDAMI